MSRGVAAEASGSDLSRPALVESYRAVHAISYLCFFLAMRHYILAQLKKSGDGPPQSTRLNTSTEQVPPGEGGGVDGGAPHAANH
jgi:hypothetical protein